MQSSYQARVIGEDDVEDGDTDADGLIINIIDFSLKLIHSVTIYRNVKFESGLCHRHHKKAISLHLMVQF